MKPPPVPGNEAERLDTLRSYDILDTEEEQDFDDLVALAAHICGTPIALISLVDKDRQWFKSSFGMADRESPRDISFCAYTIAGSGLFVVSDATRDERFADNPYVTGEPGVRFYAGSPLIAPDGMALGTLCVIDRQPRQITPMQAKALDVLSRHVMTQFELRRQSTKMARANRALLGILEDQRRAEEMIRLNNERFELAARATNDVIWDWDLQDDALSWNENFYHVFGYAPDEIERSVASWTSLLHPDDSARVLAGLFQTLDRDDISWQDEYRFRRKDGTYADVFDRGNIIRDAQGKALRMVGAMTDLTERKESAQQLKLLNTCVSHLNDIIIITEAEPIHEPGPRIVFVNEAFEKVTGYSFDEAVGRSPRFLQGSDTDRQALRDICDALAQQKPIRRQVINYGKDGTEYCFDTDIVPIFDVAGRCTHFVAIQRDITERRKAEERIAEQASFLDRARDAILVRNLEGTILFWNEGAERMYGWTKKEAIGGHVLELVQTDPRLLLLITHETTTHGEWSGELQHHTKDGRLLTVEARSTLIRDKEGRPKAVLAINTDITEKKKMEAQFMRAQRMASIGTLAGGIAHDLNNILSPILMSVELLKGSSDSPERKKILQTLEKSAKRGADIVRQVLSFARGVEGQRVEVQLKHIIGELENIIKDAFPKDIRWHFSTPNDSWTVIGDPTQLHQIFLNLCVNARDAMTHGGDLSIGVENCHIDQPYAAMHLEARPGRYVQISVTDSGTGIPADILDKIFEPFFTTKDMTKGTGLGLSTVMAIVKSHGGFVNVYSEMDRGSTFKVFLPAARTPTESLEDSVEQANLPGGNGETVLIVDDESSILNIADQTLKAYGYKVITASNGAEAVTIYAQRRDEIDLVLTDMMMPVMDGLATIHALRRLNPSVKIIAASGLNANGEAGGLTESGVRHFLTKPYTSGTLLRTLRDALQEKELSAVNHAASH
jgi:two-component system cell cycle sensor histidine kinase/response regulator CckA